MKPAYECKVKLCFSDTQDISGDIEIQFDKSNYCKDNCRLLSLGINKKMTI